MRWRRASVGVVAGSSIGSKWTTLPSGTWRPSGSRSGVLVNGRRVPSGRSFCQAWGPDVRTTGSTHGDERIPGEGARSSRPAAPARPVRHRQQVAGAHRRSHTQAGDRRLDVHRRRARRTRDGVELGRDARAAPVRVRGRHPLRHDVVEARRDVPGRVGRHVARGRQAVADRVVRARVLAHRLHDEPSRSPT